MGLAFTLNLNLFQKEDNLTDKLQDQTAGGLVEESSPNGQTNLPEFEVPSKVLRSDLLWFVRFLTWVENEWIYFPGWVLLGGHESNMISCWLGLSEKTQENATSAQQNSKLPKVNPNKLRIEWWNQCIGKEDVKMLHERVGDRLTTCGWLLFWHVFTSHVCRSYHVDSCGVFDFTSIWLILSCFTVCLLNTCYVDLVNLSLMSWWWWFWSQPGGLPR